jgi:hypothetical protein
MARTEGTVGTEVQRVLLELVIRVCFGLFEGFMARHG